MSGLGAGHGPVIVLLVALALGLRHAADPDHIVAVSTLVASGRDRTGRAAAVLGAAWGGGHAITLIAFGAPVVLAHAYIPEIVQELAETIVGLVIAVLAAQLFLRWRRGAFHGHVHEHDGDEHVHVHSHATVPTHLHPHVVRSPRRAFSIGLVHGFAGSAAVSVLIVSAASSRVLGAVALVVMALGTALSMTIFSAAFGRVFRASAARRSLSRVVPSLAGGAFVFGVWYAGAALLAL